MRGKQIAISSFVFCSLVLLLSLSHVSRADSGEKAKKKTIKAEAEITLILGSQKGGKTFPKALREWQKQLTAPPFSLFKSFRVLKQIKRPLSDRKSLSLVLVGPYLMDLGLLEGVDVKGKPMRYRFNLKLFSKKGSKKKKLLHSGRMLLDKGGTFFVAGPRHEDGTLILGITLK